MKRLHTIMEVIFIFLCSLTPLLWLRRGEVILGHDSGMRLNPFGYLQTLWYSWDHASGFGVDVNGYKGFLIAQLPEALFVRLTHSLSVGQTMSFIFWFFVIGISMYVCVRTFFSDRKYWTMRLLTSVGYMYNLFLLQGWFITERAKFSLFAALPLVFVICWLTLRGKYSIVKGSILFGWTLFVLNGGGSPPLYGGILVVLGTFVVVDIVSGFFARQGLTRMWRATRMVSSMIIVTVLFNAYWIIPQLYQVLHQYGTRLSSVGGFGGVMAWESYVSMLASFTNLFRLQGLPDWYNNKIHPYASLYNQPLFIFMSFLPMACFVYVLLRRDWWSEFKHMYNVFGVFIAIWFIGMIFTAGSHSPLGFIYTALMKYVPGFTIFRTSFYKFGPALWFSAIILFSLSATVILARYFRNKILYALASCVILIGLLLFHYPYFFTNFFLWNAPFTTKVQVPGYVSDMLSYINTTYGKEKPRILLLPPIDTSFHADGYEWGFWSLDLFTRLSLTSPTIADDTDLPIVRAMYNAIGDGNIKLFMSLAKQSGVTKVLWRGDVLYSDKVTTSNNFSFMKKAINGFAEVTEEKQFGKWILYALRDVGDIQSVQAGSLLVQADVPEESRASLFAQEDLQNLPILFTDSASSMNLQRMTEWSVTSASCVYCDPSQLRNIEEMKTVSDVNFLPNSPLYGLAKFKENWLLNSFREAPEQYINANMGYATKHLVEISSALAKDVENAGHLAEQSFGVFQHRVETIMQTLNGLPEIKQNSYRLRVISYLRFYMNYLILLEEHDGKGVLSDRFYGNAYQFVQKQIASVSRGVWTSDGPIKRYYLSIASNGLYKLSTSAKQSGAVSSMLIDGKQCNVNDVTSLSSGIHKLETFPGDLKNDVIASISTISGDIRLPDRDSYTIAIKQMSDRELYMFRLEYQVSMGENIFVQLYQNNDPQDQFGNPQSAFVFRLYADGKRHIIEEVVHPNRAVASGGISFYSADTLDQLNVVSVKNLSFTNIRSEDIFVLRNFVLSSARTPAVTSKVINPGVYQVHIEKAVSPYVMLFNEQYSADWRAYIMPSGQQIQNVMGIESLRFIEKKAIPSSQHFALNGYANAWYMTESGSYDVILLYFPQLLFILSVGITGVFIVSSLIVYFYAKNR